MRRIALLLGSLSLAALIGCGNPELTIQETQMRTLDDNHASTLVMEGDALQQELSASPAREAPTPFLRLGLRWESVGDSNLEFSTSVDGLTWSEWQPATVHHVESEETNAYVGEVELEAEANFYRVRPAGQNAPTFLAVDFLTDPVSKAMEDGEVLPEGVEEPAAGDELGEDLGTLGLALTYGPATVNSRSSWGAKAANCTSSHSPNRITVHHTVTPTNDSMSPQARLRQIQAYHMNVNGWCDIGYHFLVSRDGRLWEGRPATRLGAHVANNNSGNVGISFMGTHTSTPATNTQLDNVAKLIKGLSSKFGITINSTKIKGHRNYNSTACPGNALYAQLPTLINKAKGTSTPPPSSGTTVKGIVYKAGNTNARIAGASVKLGTRTTTSDSNGYYQFTGVAAGTYTLTVSKSGYKTFSGSKAVSGSETWASVGLSAQVATYTLKGIIYEGTNTSKRIAGATVKLGSRTTTSDSTGYYEFTGVAAGTYIITASKSGYKTTSISRAVTADPTWGSIGLPPALATGTATLKGIIYVGTNTANRVAGATVTLADGRKTTSDSTGFYQFTKLPAVTTTIKASKSGVGSGQVSRTLQANAEIWGSVGLK